MVRPFGQDRPGACQAGPADGFRFRDRLTRKPVREGPFIAVEGGGDGSPPHPDPAAGPDGGEFVGGETARFQAAFSGVSPERLVSA